MKASTRVKMRYLMKHAAELPFPKKEDEYDYNTFKGKKVYWLLDRQKPSVEPDYSFDEERLGIREDGEIIFGFDSGCSCPTPWEDEPYEVKTFKQFMMEADKVFDVEWEKETNEAIDKAYAYLKLKAKLTKSLAKRHLQLNSDKRKESINQDNNSFPLSFSFG